MSDITDAIRDHLVGSAGVTAICGTRIRRGWARASDFRDDDGNIQAYIIIIKTGGEGVHHMTAASALANPTLEVYCCAGTRGVANALSEAVREVMDGLRVSAMGDANLNVWTMRGRPAVELDEPATDASERGVFKDLLVFDVWHAQSVPVPA